MPIGGDACGNLPGDDTVLTEEALRRVHIACFAQLVPSFGTKMVGQQGRKMRFPLLHGFVGEDEPTFEEHLGQITQ
jgi:hypothetical protein